MSRPVADTLPETYLRGRGIFSKATGHPRTIAHLLGRGVRFGVIKKVAAVGEDIEIMNRRARSCRHCVARVVERDRDPAGDTAVDSLHRCVTAAGIEGISLRIGRTRYPLAMALSAISNESLSVCSHE